MRRARRARRAWRARRARRARRTLFMKRQRSMTCMLSLSVQGQRPMPVQCQKGMISKPARQGHGTCCRCPCTDNKGIGRTEGHDLKARRAAVHHTVRLCCVVLLCFEDASRDTLHMTDTGQARRAGTDRTALIARGATVAVGCYAYVTRIERCSALHVHEYKHKYTNLFCAARG